MADDEDAIYIDVVPRVDDSAADSAVSKLKDKFKDVAGNIGPEFMDSLSSSGALDALGTKLGEALSGPLKNLSEGVGLDLKNPLEKMLKQDMGGALDDLAGQLGSKLAKAVSDPLHDVASNVGIDLDTAVSKALNKDWGGLASDLGKGLGGKLTDVLGINELLGTDGLDGVMDKVHSLGDAVKAFKSGDMGGVLQGANALTGGAVQPLADMHDQIKQSVSDTKELAEGFLAGSARGGAGITAATEAFGPVAASMALTGPLEDQLNKIPWVQEHTPLPGSGGDFLKAPFRMIGGDVMHPSRLGKDHQYDKNGNFVGDGPPQENSTDRLYGSIFGSDSSGTGGGGAGGKTTANVAEVQTNSAVVSAGSVTLGGNISLPSSLTAGSSSGGTGRGLSSSPIGSLGSESNSTASLYSGSSILGKGFAGGGVLPGDSPGHDNMVGVLPSGMVGLEGGEGVIRPEAMGRPGVADLVSSLNQHYDEGSGSAGVGGDPNNTTLSTPPTQGNTAGGGDGSGIQQQQLGKGQGGGISGGGIIGAAEQAGVAAAGIAGFGGGAIAAQMAVQETNLAVQKASQSAAALATAPFETLGLAGGMMGAPKVNPMGGWIGKLISGELGSQTSLPNLAGSVQPPKKPDQKPEDGQPSQGESPSGPSGAKDDPMHVNVTNQPAPQQGTATSAANMAPMTAGF